MTRRANVVVIVVVVLNLVFPSYRITSGTRQEKQDFEHDNPVLGKTNINRVLLVKNLL